VSVAQRVKNKPELKIVVSNMPEVLAAEPAPEQVEMPFAIVNGEPVTQMPKDLYIPPQAMEVFLEAFEGPLDLLLYLIRRQNLNILDIPLAEITRQYMKYIEVMTELQLELAGEYMVMAATLAEIKSRMLLPRPKVTEEGNEEDPRAELVRRLQEYERFKRAAESIDALPRLERDVWATSAELKDRKVVRLLPTVTLQEMLIAFKDVVVRSEMFAHHHIQRERLSVRERMGDILTSLEQASFVEFVRLFRLEEGRMGVTVTFMALLELVREGLIEIVQAEAFAPIHVRAAGASRKLHVVGGNEALAAGSAVVVGDAVIGDASVDRPPTTPGDAGLERFAELALDPDFVDDSDDELEEGLLVGVDDVIALAAAAAPEVEPIVAIEPAGPDVAAAEFTTAPEFTTATEPIVNVDPTVFAPPATTVESAPPGDAPLDEPSSFDVEYPIPAEEIASGEQAVSEDEVSVVGETPVAGDVSLIGDQSVSGGPAVEVEEFAFDELPALDETRPADQQPAAGAQTVVNGSAGTDQPPSPGEESDD
jgi:chromatin segregation and condensation protein Rec8/ScpA/Scc1 (kleisin family)